MTTRHNGKCKGCGTKHTALLTRRDNVRLPDGRWVYAWRSEAGALLLATATNGSTHPVVQCECGKRVILAPVRGVYNPHKECNAKCMSACGQVCECSCGGKNHGAGACAH